ncbi:hypothetical protein ACFL6E_04995 [Candidatus Neomarinimicrobiota bacterium]
MSITFILPGAATADGATYIGRNSHRPANEAWTVRDVEPVSDDNTSHLDCRHVTLAQVRDRNGCMLAGPWWSWGGEVGSNDHGLVVAFESTLTKEHETEPGLTGYELVRLVLERSSDVSKALDVLTWLIQSYGQGGTIADGITGDCCFVIGDHQESWLVETAGRHWVARKIEEPQVLGPRLIIDDRHEYSSYSLVQYAQAKSIIREGSSVIDFAAAFATGPRRRAYFQTLEKRLHGSLKLEGGAQQIIEMMDILRTRSGDHPSQGKSDDIALHARYRRPAQTTGSMVMRLSAKRIEHFTTGAAAPDLAIFKPIGMGNLLDQKLDEHDLSMYNAESYWWRQELLHRRLIVLREIDEAYFVERSALEIDMVQTIRNSKSSNQQDQTGKQQKYLLEWEGQWLEKVAAQSPAPRLLRPFAHYWHRLNRLAELPR